MTSKEFTVSVTYASGATQSIIVRARSIYEAGSIARQKLQSVVKINWVL